MFTEPANDDGNIGVILECLKYRRSRWSERECALVDKKRMLLVHVGISLTKPDGVLDKYTKCFMVGAVGLVNLPQRTRRGDSDEDLHEPNLSIVSSAQLSVLPSSSRSSPRSNEESVNAKGH